MAGPHRGNMARNPCQRAWQDKSTRHLGAREGLSARGLARHAFFWGVCRNRSETGYQRGIRACRLRCITPAYAGLRSMSKRDEDRFRIRPGAPKAHPPRFITRVLAEVHKAGVTTARRGPVRPGARIGRGHVAARLLGTAQANARRVTIKSRIVNLKSAGAGSPARHLRYIEREGVARDAGPTHAYGPATDAADLQAFEARGREDRHQFRFIIAPEDADQLEDLHGYTRALMARMEADLGTKLDWVAVDHWDTDNAHTHVVLRGKDETGHDLVIAGAYMAHGMRQRASELATQWLGPRTELEIEQSLRREVDQERWTGLDRALQRAASAGVVRLDRLSDLSPPVLQQRLLLGRLHRLRSLGLAAEAAPGTWALRPDGEQVLRAMGERGDIVRTLQRAMAGTPRELVIANPGVDHAPVIGRIAAKGLVDELHDRGYLVVDGLDGRAHYVPLGARADLEQFPVGGIVEARGARDRAADKTIVAHTRGGVYRAHEHRAALGHDAISGRDPDEVVATHVRRLEALRRAGHVQRVADGVWQVPSDLVQRGRQHDSRELGGSSVELRSHLPIGRQTRVTGATWLDQQLIAGASGVSDRGFGADVRLALRERAEFLIEQGFAQRRGTRVLLMRDVLATLARSRARRRGARHRGRNGLDLSPRG